MWSQVWSLFSPWRCLPSIFIAHRVRQSHCSSIFHGVLLTHALALSASQFVHKKKSQRIYTSMHSAGLELTKLAYTRPEDNLIRHRGDRYINAGYGLFRRASFPVSQKIARLSWSFLGTFPFFGRFSLATAHCIMHACPAAGYCAKTNAFGLVGGAACGMSFTSSECSWYFRALSCWVLLCC